MSCQDIVFQFKERKSHLQMYLSEPYFFNLFNSPTFKPLITKALNGS